MFLCHQCSINFSDDAEIQNIWHAAHFILIDHYEPRREVPQDRILLRMQHEATKENVPSIASTTATIIAGTILDHSQPIGVYADSLKILLNPILLDTFNLGTFSNEKRPMELRSAAKPYDKQVVAMILKALGVDEVTQNKLYATIFGIRYKEGSFDEYFKRDFEVLSNYNPQKKSNDEANIINVSVHRIPISLEVSRYYNRFSQQNHR